MQGTHSQGIRVLEANNRRRTFPAVVNGIGRFAGVKRDALALGKHLKERDDRGAIVHVVLLGLFYDSFVLDRSL